MEYWLGSGGDRVRIKECIGMLGRGFVHQNVKEGLVLEIWKFLIKLYWVNKFGVYFKTQHV